MAVQKFSKEQLLTSVRFVGQRDLLHALLDDDKEYSIAEVEKLIKEYNEREV